MCYSLAYPNAVEYVSVGEDPDVEVWLDDVVELALLLVPEEGVWHPHLNKIFILKYFIYWLYNM